MIHDAVEEGSIIDSDERFMRRALALAAETAGLASPNPQVGCVLVRNDETIAEGAHLYDRLDHAEVAALKRAAKAGRSVEGATAYVTLEPCSHQGRTGPCADALIAARIARCVVATDDPNPQVCGRGIDRLRAAGIAVTAGTMQSEARRLNDAFAHFIRIGRPFVTLKAALSVDGKLAPDAAKRIGDQPYWLTGPAARADVQRIRHDSDAILTGIGTVLADNPTLTDRTALPRRRLLLRVILDPRLRTPLTANILHPASDDLLILCSEDALQADVDALMEAGAEVRRVPSGQSGLSLPAVLNLLAERQMLSLLVEAGSALNAAFLRSDLVDQLILFLTDTELGFDAMPFAEGISPVLLQQRLQHQTRTSFPYGPGEDIRITGYLHDPWCDALP